MVQGRYYKVGGEIARLEQSIEHARELRERQENDLEQAVQGAREIAAHIDQDQTEIEQLELTLSELVPGLEQARRERTCLVSVAATGGRGAGGMAEAVGRALTAVQRSDSAAECRAYARGTDRIPFAELCRTTSQDRRIAIAMRALKSFRLKHDQLVEQELRKRQARDEFERHLSDIGEKIRKLREQDHKLTRLVEERRSALQAAQGKFASLEALQQAALGEGDEGIKDWLRGRRARGQQARSADPQCR